jgi:hypothetical protein
MDAKIESEPPTAEPNAAPTVEHTDRSEKLGHTSTGQCGAVKADGQWCHARALVNSQFCYFHNPASADERIAASRRGGERNRAATLPADTPDFPLATATDASALIGRTINQLLRGEIDPKIATAVGYLVTVKVKAADTGTLERRLAALEAILKATNQD